MERKNGCVTVLVCEDFFFFFFFVGGWREICRLTERSGRVGESSLVVDSRELRLPRGGVNWCCFSAFGLEMEMEVDGSKCIYIRSFVSIFFSPSLFRLQRDC